MQQQSELKKRIKSVAEIKKITRAMHLISAVKMRRARSQLEQTMPFFTMCADTMLELWQSGVILDNRYFRLRQKKAGEIWKIGYFILTGDQGLAGAYNQNVLGTAESHIHAKMIDNTQKGLQTDVKLFVAGSIGKERLARAGFNVIDDFQYPISEPTYYRARDISDFIQDLYESETLDLVYFIYTRIESAVSMTPMVTRILPVNAGVLEDLIPPQYLQKRAISAGSDIIYEPSASELMQYLFDTYLNGMVYGALTEAYASEQTARMTAMDNATGNADEMLEKLHMQNNHARQNQITQELSEIVGGAEVLSQEQH